jgi:type 1 glutamine amidotransferase
MKTLLRAGLFLVSAFALLAADLPAEGSAKAGSRPKLAMLIAEPEYETEKSLPPFAAEFLAKDFRVVFVLGAATADVNHFEGINEIADADVILVSVRRRTPPKGQLDAIRRHVMAGKPVVGIRTASHAFSLRANQAVPEGMADWPTWDAQVIGGSYTNHHGKGPATTITATEGQAAHPILRGVKLPFTSEASLYKSAPLRASAVSLLTGAIPGQAAEPVAWTFKNTGGGKTFYTSLGGPADFKNPSFQQLLRNGLLWAAGKL